MRTTRMARWKIRATSVAGHNEKINERTMDGRRKGDKSVSRRTGRQRIAPSVIKLHNYPNHRLRASSNGGACSSRASVGSGSDTTAFTFSFDILNNSSGIRNDDPVDKDIDGDNRGLTLTGSGLVTRELFPVGGIGQMRLEGWSHRGDTADLRRNQPIVQEQKQQVQQLKARKSRRGPRSRSSQYRGVTFYRRTGRWESHIW